MDGRLGDAPPPHARLRLVHRSPRAARAQCAASWWTPASSKAIIPSVARSKDATSAAARHTRMKRKLCSARKRNGSSCCRNRGWPAIRRIRSRSSSAGRFTHLRLNIFPDGGVARLRVHGEVAPRAGRGSRAGIRSRGRRKRRQNRRVERPIFRRAAQHADAGPRAQHGRRLGDAAQARPRPRLGHHQARRAGNDPPNRSEHRALQGKFPGELRDRRLLRRRCRSGSRRRRADKNGNRCWRKAC